MKEIQGSQGEVFIESFVFKFSRTSTVPQGKQQCDIINQQRQLSAQHFVSVNSPSSDTAQGKQHVI